MKKILSISFLMFILSVNAHAYVDMTDQAKRAKDLKMTIEDYAFSMAITGALSGTIFGLFLWKVK